MHAVTHKRPWTRLLSALLALALAACGGTSVRGEAPLGQTAGWRIEDGNLFLALRLRNVNDEPLTVQDLALDVAVDGAPALRNRPITAVEIAPGGFETVLLELGNDPDIIARFDRLSSGAVGSMPYRVSGTVVSARIGALPLRLDGRIYRVPGRGDEFR